MKTQKSPLQGQTVTLEVYKFIPHPENYVSASYVWAINSEIISAGMMPNAPALIEDVIETHRNLKPEYIHLTFPKPPLHLTLRWWNQLKELNPAEIEHCFKKALAGYKVIGLDPHE